MPLEPQPPPSPVGKSLPHSNMAVPCHPHAQSASRRLESTSICSPTWGRCKAWFAQPAIPCHMLQFLVKSPSTWTWTTKASPRARKSFSIPSLSTACSKDSLRVILWIISIFHAFKAQLVPQALSQETGRVLPDYVKVYQNNKLVHVRSQQAQHQARVKPSSPCPECPQSGPKFPHSTSPRADYCQSVITDRKALSRLWEIQTYTRGVLQQRVLLTILVSTGSLYCPLQWLLLLIPLLPFCGTRVHSLPRSPVAAANIGLHTQFNVHQTSQLLHDPP